MKISQREAHRMRKELRALHERDAKRQRSWSSDWPGGVNIAWSEPNAVVVACIKTARQLGHAVIAVQQSDGKVLYFALQNEVSK